MKPTHADFKKIQLATTLLLAGAFLSIAWSIYFSLVTISIPYQIEYREGTAQVLTGFFLRWENPFVLESQPLAMNNYGLGYNLIVLPFAALLGNTLLVHRSVTFVFVLLSALLGFSVAYKKTRNNSLALTYAAFIMIGLIGHGGIGAFPSALGTFLFLVAIFAPFLRSFDLISLIISILTSLMAFYTKPYFLLAFGIVSSYLFLFVSKRKSALYSLAFIIAFALLAFAVSYMFPLYFINTIIGNVSNTHMTFENLFIQLRDLFFFFYPVLFLVSIFLTIDLFDKRFQKEPRLNRFESLFNFSKWNSPLIDHPVHFLLYSFICSFLVFLFVLGPHIGNYMNYAYQLLIPTFFCWFFQEITFKGKMEYVFAVAVLFNLFAWGGEVLSPDMLKQKDSKEWTRLFEYVHSSTMILNSPAIVSEMVKFGQIPMDSGQTSYFYLVKPFSDSLLVNIPYDKFHRDGIRYVSLIDQRVEKQKFDLLILTKEKATFFHSKRLSDYYMKVDELKLEMPQTYQTWTMVVWVPLDD